MYFCIRGKGRRARSDGGREWGVGRGNTKLEALAWCSPGTITM